MDCSRQFTLPETGLSSLPTGSVKALANIIGRRIADGSYAPGQTLPMEEELSREHNVSRTVLREAIKVLSGKGLVRTARRHGTRVCEFADWNLLDPDVIRWHDPTSPTAERIRSEASVMRLIFEPEAAWRAAQNATEAQVEVILAAAKSITPEPYGVEGIIAADYAFHDTILQATGLVMLSKLNGLILAVLPFYHGSNKIPAVNVEELRAQHVAVAEAIAAREPENARSRMRAMLST